MYIVVSAPTCSCKHFKYQPYVDIYSNLFILLTQFSTVPKLGVSVYPNLTALHSITYIKLYVFQAMSLLPLVNCASGHPSHYSHGWMAPHVFVKQYICVHVPCVNNC